MIENRETWLIEPNGERQEQLADEHIARECEKIQEQWTEKQRVKRSKWATSPPLTLGDEIAVSPNLAKLLDMQAT